MKLWKYSGYLFIATGIVHNIIGFVMGWEVLEEIAKNGFFNTVHDQMDRNAIFWFLFSGFIMMLMGKLMQDIISQYSKPLPLKFGYYLLILTIIGCLMMPISGFWSLIPQALIIIIGDRKSSKKQALKYV